MLELAHIRELDGLLVSSRENAVLQQTSLRVVDARIFYQREQYANDAEVKACEVRPCSYGDSSRIRWIRNPSTVAMIETKSVTSTETAPFKNHIDVGIFE